MLPTTLQSCKYNNCVFIYKCVFPPGKMWIEVCFPSLVTVMGVRSPVIWGRLHTRDHLHTAEVVKGKKSYLHPVKLFLMVSSFDQMAFLQKIDHRTSQTEAKPVFTDCKNKIQLHFRRSSYLLTAVHTQRECWAIQLHFPATRQKFKQKTRLWSLCSTDNKWPWVRLSCYHWLWSLSGLTVETWHISCNFV